MSNYIKSNAIFRGWIDNRNNIIEIPRGQEHWEYSGSKSTDARIKEDDWIRFYSDREDVTFEVKNLDNSTFRRIYNFFKQHLRDDTRTIFIQDATKNKAHFYEPQFKEGRKMKQRYNKYFKESFTSILYKETLKQILEYIPKEAFRDISAYGSKLGNRKNWEVTIPKNNYFIKGLYF